MCSIVGFFISNIVIDRLGKECLTCRAILCTFFGIISCIMPNYIMSCRRNNFWSFNRRYRLLISEQSITRITFPICFITVFSTGCILFSNGLQLVRRRDHNRFIDWVCSSRISKHALANTASPVSFISILCASCVFFLRARQSMLRGNHNRF